MNDAVHLSAAALLSFFRQRSDRVESSAESLFDFKSPRC
jgi:hypothetical protein